MLDFSEKFCKLPKVKYHSESLWLCELLCPRTDHVILGLSPIMCVNRSILVVLNERKHSYLNVILYSLYTLYNHTSPVVQSDTLCVVCVVCVCVW